MSDDAAASLGLTYGTIRLVAHHPRWAALFAVERDRLRRAASLRECAIEHIGSTAVPGLIAKPILDIAIALPSTRVEAVLGAFEALGYVYRGDAGNDGGHVFVRGPQPDFRTHHVHVVEPEDDSWRDYLDLRELLRRDAGARAAYADEKTRLAKIHHEDRKAYTAAKGPIVARLLRKAPP